MMIMNGEFFYVDVYIICLKNKVKKTRLNLVNLYQHLLCKR